MTHKHFFILLVLVLLFTGCSRNIKITGTVKFDDGEPVSFGAVVFETPEHSFIGKLNENGHYAVGVERDGTGIPAGEYNVWLTDTQKRELILKGKADGESESGWVDIVTDRVDRKYTRNDTYVLSFTVSPQGPKNYDISVERPPVKKQASNTLKKR